MRKIKIYTDSSFKKNKAGISFLINFPDKDDILAYTNLKCRKSIQAELLAITHALKYLLSIDMSYQDVFIDVATDEFSIVEVFNNQKYKMWDLTLWKKEDGKTVIRCAKEWFELSCLVKCFEDKIHFSKVTNKDSGNRIVHTYASYAKKIQLCSKNSLHIIERKNGKDFEDNGILITNSNKELEKILNSKKPWECTKEEKDFDWYNKGKDELIYVNPDDIIITEDVHLKCNSLNFGTLFRNTAESCKIQYPVAIKLLANGKYALIAGITRLITAKLFNIPRIPCVLTDLSHQEFIKKRLLNAD